MIRLGKVTDETLVKIFEDLEKRDTVNHINISFKG